MGWFRTIRVGLAAAVVGMAACMVLVGTAAAQTESVLFSFTGTAGAAPGSNAVDGNLMQASNGSFYGTALKGGTHNDGTLFAMSSLGSYTSLYAFTQISSTPEEATGGLIQGTDGNFYGMTNYGGSGFSGTIFKITPGGTLSVLHSFTVSKTDGAYPSSGLVQGTDGNFYGVTQGGGAQGDGIVFKVTPAGIFTLMHSFSGATTDGNTPIGGLVQGTDGNFYGTTNTGGANNVGTIFKISPTSPYTLTLMHSFTAATEGQNPEGTLVQGMDGFFYGTAYGGGSGSDGTAFKISPVSPYALTVLHSFAGGATDAANLEVGLVLGSDGNFYGTSYLGGSSSAGTAFAMTPSGTVTVLHSFAGGTGDGANPFASLVQGADGNFYGTTTAGGASSDGTAFRIVPSLALTAPVALGAPANVAKGAGFTLSYAVANATSASMQQCFATNTAGDTTGWVGIKTASTSATDASLTAPSTLGTYTYTLTCGGVESSSLTLTVPPPVAPTTATVSAVTAPLSSTAGITVTATENGLVGAYPGVVVTFSVTGSATGSFSPTTCTLGSGGTCTTTYIPTGSLPVGTYTNDIQASFAANNAYTAATGASTLTIATYTPTVSVSAVTAKYQSTTPMTVTATETGSVGTANGSVVTFGVTSPATGSFSPTTCTISSGSCTTTYTPTGTLAVGIYANDITASFTASGGYTAANAASTLMIDGESVLVNFTGNGGAAPGTNPLYGNLIQASDGNFYGTTDTGGANGYGTVFQVSSAGAYTVLHSFANAKTDGEFPRAGLVQGTDGNFYGTTYAGGANGYGTVFKINSSGAFTLLHSFAFGTTDGTGSMSSLVQGTDGNFYGTTPGGGANGYGTVFQISPVSPYPLTLLHSFSNATTDGAAPYGGLVQGVDGYFYGTTYYGGANTSQFGSYGCGTVFKISPTSPYSLTVLHSFSNATTDGSAPYAGLVQGTDGNFYGTTFYGGANGYGGYGTVFEISPTSPYPLTLLHSFSGALSDGEYPEAGLVQGTDGEFYGTTFGETAFKINSTEMFTLLHSFSNATTDGYAPQAGLVQGAEGSFYGITSQGGTSGDGTIFKLATSPVLSAPVVLSVPSSVYAGTTFTLGYSVANAPPAGSAVGTLQQCFATNTAGDTTGWTGIQTGLATTTNASLTAPAAAGAYTYTLTCGGVESSSVTLNVVTVSTTTTVFNPLTNPQAGVPVTLYAGVQSSPVATGTVTFLNSTTIPGCSAQPVSNAGNYGSASCTTIFSSLGVYEISATYNGNPPFLGSTSGPTFINVVPAQTATEIVSASANPATVGRYVTLYGAVTGPPSVTTGTVTFTANGSTISGCSMVPLLYGEGEAVCVTEFALPGTYSLVAQYSGTTLSTSSTSSPFSETVNAAAPAISFTVPTHHTIDQPFTVAASSNSSGAFTYSYVSGPATLSGSTVTLTGAAGTVQLSVSQAATVQYTTGTQTVSFNVVAGSVWLGNAGGSLSIFGSDGAALLNETGGGLGTLATPLGEAFDSSGNLWVASSNGVSEFTETGTPAQSTAFLGGGISNPVALAVDGAGFVWIANANSTVSELNNAGAAISPSVGYPATGSGTPGGVAIDLSGSVWVTNQTTGTVTQIIGAAAPAAPASTALKNGTTGSKP